MEFLEEKRERAMMRNVAYKQKVARYFDKRVKERKFQVGDLVLRRVFLNTKEVGAGALGPTCEGPYKMAEELRSGTYKLTTMGGSMIPRA